MFIKYEYLSSMMIISYDDDYYHSIYNLDHLDGKIYE